MGWPPAAGEFLPHAGDAVGVERKLVMYSLNQAHDRGGPKARGIELILGITVEWIGHLEAESRSGIRHHRISSVRKNSAHGWNCVVEFHIRRVGSYSERTVNLRTVWELTRPGLPPRLISAFPRPKG